MAQEGAGAYCLPLHSWRMRQATNLEEPAAYPGPRASLVHALELGRPAARDEAGFLLSFCSRLQAFQ